MCVCVYLKKRQCHLYLIYVYNYMLDDIYIPDLLDYR